MLKLSGDYKLYNVQAFWRYYSILKVQIISNLTRNKSLELVPEHTHTFSTLFLDFLILICSFIYRESSELVDRRYVFKKYVANILLQMLLVFGFSHDFLAQFIGMICLLLKCSSKLDYIPPQWFSVYSSGQVQKLLFFFISSCFIYFGLSYKNS